jgi:hypothetical protein
MSSYNIFVVINRQGTPYPATAGCSVERCQELAQMAFGASWAVLVAQGWRIAAGMLTIGAVVEPVQGVSA